MSALRRRLTAKRPEPYLALVAAAFLAVALDASRAPGQQWSARAYVAAVRGYQHYGRPLTNRVIACRYRPTCSEYSAEAVRRFGLAAGLRLSLRRLLACRGDVAMGSPDPVPALPAAVP